ncbi:hypothetical protein [Photobacterium kishitanii]|uniref:Uncharacterized protein n=1 Tax=Photobacterium kishitanii TaxID=318456 RepID=A0A2T3KLU4_9GAMM|nr:hypothetical protein [Photobacterium kishitanii]PSV00658.1 hypothetical protein C9J27_05835 [Photobacterium kishitanii]
MSTTIQIAEDLSVGRFIEIKGQRYTVESVSFTKALTKNNNQEALLEVMKNELIERGAIDTDQAGQCFWMETGKYLVPENDLDED